MNSFVLLIWLVLVNGDGNPTGNQKMLATRFFDTATACERAGQAETERHARRGERVIWKCHETIPEYTGDDIDVNGNPIPR